MTIKSMLTKCQNLALRHTSNLASNITYVKFGTTYGFALEDDSCAIC